MICVIRQSSSVLLLRFDPDGKFCLIMRFKVWILPSKPHTRFDILLVKSTFARHSFSDGGFFICGLRRTRSTSIWFDILPVKFTALKVCSNAGLFCSTQILDRLINAATPLSGQAVRTSSFLVGEYQVI